ncbi:hypothetical protein LXM63_12000 [Chryseobacterium gleum]|uniref:hypothetical protein n=1 Tax=Chryseobacterium gleum TaxID=250 RepID=UPI001E39E5B9|nr:hypothetical protein [Chryseobacterium gleum]MCE4065820.1 hypothetical protein [Chryseobacterium gleum]
MKRKSVLSNSVLGIISVSMMVLLIPMVAAVFINTSASSLCISVFLILLEIEFLFLCFIPNWKLLIFLRGNIRDKEVRLNYFLTTIPLFLIGGFVSLWSASKLYLETIAAFKDYRAGTLTYYCKGKFPGWVTYSIESDYVEFTAEIILRLFFAGLWGYLLEFGILMITVAFAFIIRPTFRNTQK